MKNFKNLLLSVVLVSIFGCAGVKDYVVTIKTRHGNIVAILFDDTPAHKSNFIGLAEAGRYDSTEFHRVIRDFMVQGGDVYTKEGLPPAEWPTLPAEIRPGHYHKKGMIAAARQGDGINPERRSNGSQFYIVLGKVYSELELTTDMAALQKAFLKYMELGTQKELKEKYVRLYTERKYDSLNQLLLSKRKELEENLHVNLTKEFTEEELEAYTTVGGTKMYTVFGQVIQGLEVAERISGEPTDQRDKPLDPIYMKVTVDLMSRKKIEREYGYSYPDEK